MEKMIKFNSPIIPENSWNLCLKTNKEITDIYNKDRIEEKEEHINQVIDFFSATIYIDKDLEDNMMLKSLMKNLTSMYLWETGQDGHKFTEEEFCDLTSVSAPIIFKTANELLKRIKKETVTSDSFVNKELKWEVQLKTDNEMTDIFYKDKKREEGISINGLTDYLNLKIYINENLDGFILIKTIRHELMHVYLWENNKIYSLYSEDEVREILSDAIPLINIRAEEIFSKIKK